MSKATPGKKGSRTKVQNEKKNSTAKSAHRQRECPTCREGKIEDKRRDFGNTSVAEIAKAAKRDQSTVSRIFTKSRKRGVKRDTTFSTACRIADYLGITLDELRGIIQ